MKYWGIAALLAPSLAVAAQAEPVWKTVSLGMTRAEVDQAVVGEARVKRKGQKSIEIADVPIVGECKAEVNVFFSPAGIADRVLIAGNPSLTGRCATSVLTAMSSKYGEPLNRDRVPVGLLQRQASVFTWSRPGGMAL